MGFWQRLVSSDTHFGLRFDRFIYSMIIASLVLFALETLPEAEPYKGWFDWSERAIVTTGGRTFTFVILILGLGVVAVPSGLFASALSTQANRVNSTQP